MLGLVAALLTWFFYLRISTTGSEADSQDFLLPCLIPSFVKFDDGGPCLHGGCCTRPASSMGSVHQSRGRGAWRQEVHMGTLKAGSYLCSLCDGCSLGSLSEPHTFSQVDSCNTKAHFLSYFLVWLTELTLVIVFIGDGGHRVLDARGVCECWRNSITQVKAGFA